MGRARHDSTHIGVCFCFETSVGFMIWLRYVAMLGLNKWISMCIWNNRLGLFNYSLKRNFWLTVLTSLFDFVLRLPLVLWYDFDLLLCLVWTNGFLCAIKIMILGLFNYCLKKKVLVENLGCYISFLISTGVNTIWPEDSNLINEWFCYRKFFGK